MTSNQDLSRRLRTVRERIYGEKGTAAIARALRIAEESWLTYEGGTAVPAQVILEFIVRTGVEPEWLLDGDDPAGTRGLAVEFAIGM